MQVVISLIVTPDGFPLAYEVLPGNTSDKTTPEDFLPKILALNAKKLRQVRRREDRYLLRSNLCGEDPPKLWEYYIQLAEVEQAFKELKSDLAVRPIIATTASRHTSSSHSLRTAFRSPSGNPLALRPRRQRIASGLGQEAAVGRYPHADAPVRLPDSRRQGVAALRAPPHFCADPPQLRWMRRNFRRSGAKAVCPDRDGNR